MTAVLSEITGRQKAFAGDIVSLGDFTLGQGREVGPEIVLSSSDWSLYAIDVEKGFAMFVELPAGTDLSTVPFVYMAQFDRAVRAVVLPIDLLEPLSQKVVMPESLGILFSTGRCGSTLASSILAQVPGVWSLSEPDCLNNLAFARFQLPQNRMIPLISTAMRLLCRPPADLNIRTIVIKPRSESMIQAPEFALALPHSRNVFMYRDAEGFTNSLYQFVQKLIGPEMFFGSADAWQIGWPFSSVNAPLDLLDDYFPDDRASVGFAETMLLAWVLRMDAYRAALDHGIKMQPLHYHDLNTRRREETARLLGAFGIPLDHIDLAMRGFEKDSQSGTGGDRALPARPLDDGQRRRIYHLLARWGKPDYREERLPTGS